MPAKELTIFLFSDLMPWERSGLMPLLERLASQPGVDVIEVGPNEYPVLKKGNSARAVWIVSYQWQDAIRRVSVPPTTRVYASVLGFNARRPSFVALFWSRFRSSLPLNVHLLVHSPLTYRFLKEIQGVEEDQLSFIDLPFSPQQATRPKDPGGEITVGSFARLVSESNLNYIASVAHYVAQRSSSTRFKIVGSGPLRDHALRMIRELGIDNSVSVVSPTGQSSDYDFDISLYVPLQNHHFLPLLASAAVGHPIVASELPGIDELIVDGRDGFLVPANETKPIAELVLRLADDARLRHSIGEKLKARLTQNYSLEKLIPKYQDLLLRNAQPAIKLSHAA